MDTNLFTPTSKDHLRKSEIKRMPEFFDRYIALVEDIPLDNALEEYGMPVLLSEVDKFRLLGDKVYAPDKWTIKDILQHIIDSERVFAYRALRFARNDKTPLPGYDENAYAIEAKANRRTIEDLINEFKNQRTSTKDLFNSFTPDQLQFTGICFNKEISVLALGFTLTGHLQHHLNVIKERYYPLL